MVFEDVGYETNILLTLNNWRCGDFTPKADMGEGFNTIILEHHILKHHIPEYPTHHRLHGKPAAEVASERVQSISEISSCFFGPRPWHIEIRYRVNKNIHNYFVRIWDSQIENSKIEIMETDHLTQS